MKTLIIITLSFSALLLTACSDDSDMGMSAGNMETAVEHGAKHADANYVCPMHPQIIRGKPGNCPICGMDLIKKEAEVKREKKLLYWVAPMDANYRRDEPGKSPMGMDLVPVYDDGEDGLTVKISPTVENNMGVRTALVKKDMQMLQTLIGHSSDDTTAELLSVALGFAKQRVVVKRPKGAEILNGPEPTMSLHSKKTRYDVYVIKTLKNIPV